MSHLKRPTLLPADSTSNTTPSDRSPPFLTRAVVRRHMTTNACVGCRKKRAKCDGRSPCSRCVARNERCTYKAKASITKDDLRAEVESLRSERLNTRAVLNALLLDKHEGIVQRLRSGETVESIAQGLIAEKTDDDDDDDGQEMAGIRQEQPSTPMPLSSAYSASQSTASSAKGPKGTDPALNAIIKQFKVDHTASPTGGIVELPEWLITHAYSAAIAEPPLSTQPGASRRHSFDDTSLAERLLVLGNRVWTKVTPDRALLKHLIELFFSWEFPPFTMVSEQLFLRDFYHGGRQFCSPALVNAIACVATRYLEPSQATSSGEAHLLGEQFFSEAKGLLVVETQMPSFPSIQTFALLAVREMSCGRELEAQELCIQAVRLLCALDFEDLEAHRQSTNHLVARSITFAGILTLTRAIRLITDQLSPASNYYYSDLPLVSNLAPRDNGPAATQLHERMSELRSKMHRDPKSKPSDMLSSFIFDQTEYVYSFLFRAGRVGSPRTIEHLPAVYRKCLQSYETITNFMKEQGDSSPCTLFAHIYFHFCLLTLFRPFVNFEVDVAGISPRTVCSEAVQAILDVTQSYADLFTLRRTPCFVPYFVFAAGLTRIVLESNETTENSSSPASAIGSSPATVNTELKSPHEIGASNDGGDISMSGIDSQSSLSPTWTTSTATTAGSTSATTASTTSEEERGLTQAVLQLQEMSVGHPAAAQAGWVLRDFDPRQKDSR